MNFQKQKSGQALRLHSGQAALMAVFFMMTIMLSAVVGSTALALKEERVATVNMKARRAFFAAEAGIDDVVYRTPRDKTLSPFFFLSFFFSHF